MICLQGDDLIAYLKNQLENKEKELFVIIPLEVERSQVWQHPETDCSTQVATTDSMKKDDLETTRQHTSSSGSSGAGGSVLPFECKLRTTHSISRFPWR